jgi:four helix bundle protein
MRRFEALELSFSAIRELRDVLAPIRLRSASLARQIENAAASIALNLGEGSRRSGRDRLHHYRIAAGSADEVCCALKVAEALGYLSAGRIARCLKLLDRVLAILWTITKA